ncbi:NB-ARC domain-containing protein [Microcystis sp. M034S2]|uniref:NB-ARC domain-containing protein n=1 Tax=Microcystis sp. M034S2 TaxID=2771162 RepID=UPI00258DDF3B|nr:NB-ARC domain-containing protein [Microcystis sp. M034S2]MCA2693527.1 trypsin-like serine protease [Microcystis sp. M034S2]
MPQFQPDRALEIVAPKYGTAYRIGGRLLLTCRHLFDNSNDCKVRFRSASNYSDKQDIDAKVIWKAPDNIDIALVELPETIETCNPVSFGLLPDASSTQKVKFDFLGFPLFLRYSEDGIKYATGLHIQGTIDVANRVPHNRLLLNIKDSQDIQPTDEQLERLAEDQSPWQGTSGSAIVCYGLVIGVQSKQPIRDRPASLEAESLARVYDNPEWCEILENHDIDPEPKPVISASLKSSSYRNQAPPKPSYFVERPEVSIELKKLLLSEITEKTGTLVISAIYGLGGIGKSTLAAALAQEKEVQAYFPDGIFWATLGQQPDILSFLHGWIQALGDYNFKPTGIDAASLHLRTLLADKKALLVVDDLWNVEDIDPFRVAVNQCKLLVTTREVPVKGAIRYDLDVMTESQSLALLTGYLKHELNLADQKQAKILAKIVGYLPLALELTAAQIEDEIPWTELIEDLRAEIAHLEILDRLEAGDTVNEEKRKHYSLIACFNLSLKRLNGQRLRQFSWLGVLPDDVTITEKMAATLWDCPVREARQTLRYLRSKALLLTGVSSELLTSYRVHDLLHDLARNLILASPHPETDYRLPGLGLSMAEAHQQLLQRYQKQIKISPLTPLEKGGKEVEVPLEKERSPLTPLEKGGKEVEVPLEKERSPLTPLEKGGKEVEVPLSKGDLGGSNWHSLEDDGYIYNQLLWHLEKAGQIAQIHLLLREKTAEGHNGWYSQCEREGKTAVFIKDVSRAWQLAEGHFIENPSESIGLQVRYTLITTSLNSLAANIPPELIAALIKHEIWTPAQGLAYVRQNQDAKKKTAGLREISPCLPPALLPEALEIARGIGDKSDRAWALTELVPHLPEVLPEALEVARGIGKETVRAWALTRFVSRLPEVLPEALATAKTIENESDRGWALTRLAPYFPEVSPEVLVSARAICFNDFDLARMLSMLAPHLPESLLPKALKIARGIGDKGWREAALTKLAFYLPEALVVAEALENEYRCAKIWEELEEAFPKELEEAVEKAVEKARVIGDEDDRAKALRELAPYVLEVLPEALEIARGIGDEYSCAKALTGLALYLPEVLLEALEVARAIGDECDRAEALTELAFYLPEMLLEALEVARAIGDECDRAKALTELAPYLPKVLPEALEIARAFEYGCDRAEALTELAPYLPESLFPEALEIARAIADEHSCARALTELAPYLPESLFLEALEIARGIGYSTELPIWRKKEIRAEALTKLVPYLPESLFMKALEIARGIGNEYFCAKALIGLAPHLSEALTIARAFEDERNRVWALIWLAPYFPEVLPEALATAKTIEYERDCVWALTELAPYFPEVLPEALEIARGIEDEYDDDRAWALIWLAPYFPEVLPEALATAKTIEYEGDRVRALTGLAPYLPESLLSEALEVARAIEYKYEREKVLTELVTYLPESLLPEALEIVRAIEYEGDRASVLRGLAPHLPVVLPKALAVAREIGSEEYRARVLEALTATLTPANVDLSFWQDILHALGTLTRPKFLETIPNLAPLILHFGGEVALREVYQSIRDVSRWWR